MSDQSNARMLELYADQAPAPLFLAGFFQSPPQNFHNTEKVEIDIIRDEAEIAVVVQDLTVGGRDNASTKYVNKAFTPPIFNEEGTITAYDLIKRSPGQDPFTDPNFGANATREAFRIFDRLVNKIRRSVELEVAQVLQDGTISLVDNAGVVLYTLDFGAKASHKATVGTTWATNGSAGDPLGDLASLADVVRRDGKMNPTRLIFGTSAIQRFLANADVKARLDNRAMQIGQVAPQTRGQGATFQGWVWIGYYRFEMWTYDGYYKHPQSGTLTPYIGADNVIMMSEGARLDLSWGAIPILRRPESGAMSFIPPRMSSGDRGFDFTTNAWFTPDGRHLKLSAGTRPLAIPTAIDTFARLDVTV